jgi:hypothetical protein
MRTNLGWTTSRTAVLVLALGMVSSTVADAAASKAASDSASINYNTTGSVGLDGITGRNVVSFRVTGGSFTAPSSFSLGEFMVGALDPGEATTYDNTPFSISYLTQMVDGVSPTPNQTPITLTGVLNGTFTGANQSDVVATFDPTTQALFRTGDFLNSLTISAGTIALVPATTNDGRTTVQGQIIVHAAPIPEPASLAVFVFAAGAGLMFRRRMRARVS